MRISTLTRLLEDKIVAAAKASAPRATRIARSAKHFGNECKLKAAHDLRVIAAKLDPKED